MAQFDENSTVVQKRAYIGAMKGEPCAFLVGQTY